MVCLFFFFNDTATTEIYTSIDTLSLHDALPISRSARRHRNGTRADTPDPFARSRSEEHTSELQSPIDISYAVFCLKKKREKKKKKETILINTKQKTENKHKKK